MLKKTALPVALLVCAGMSHAIGLQDASRRETLDNGITVMMQPIADVGQVAVESFYDVGFMDEPAGLPQSAHLLEHLVCYARMPGFEPGESFAMLNELGMANAETMPAFTHYDAFVPAGKLETVLRIESARLSGLTIDEAIIRQEGPRACREVDFVEQNPQGGMLKFAFMALAQAWRHGGDDVTIGSGLDAYPVEAMQQFFDRVYLPRNLTLIIVGEFDPDEAMELVRTHLGGLTNHADAEPIPPIDWSSAPKRSTVTWDSSTRAVCIAFPPPDDPVERATLTLLGSTVLQRLATDNEIGTLTNVVFPSSTMWPVGDLPLFIYAAVRPEASLEEVETLITARMSELIENRGSASARMLGQVARGVAAGPRQINEPALRRMADLVARQRGIDADRAMAMALGQGAINWGIAMRFLGDEPDALLEAIDAVTADDLNAIIAEHLAADRMIVTHIVPRDAGE